MPRVAAHLFQQRAFLVHDLVVRQREDEVFTVRVQAAEGQLVVVVRAVDGIFGQVRQRVVHKAHVPLHAKAQTSHVRWVGDAGPRGRLLCNHLHVGEVVIDLAV